MNDENKNKLRMQDIMNELTNLKKYNNDLANSSKGEKIQNYINELNNNIIKAQNKAETIYNENYK